MSWLSALKSVFGLGKVASRTTSASKAAATVTKTGKTIINASKGSKIVLQMGEAGASVAKAANTAAQSSKIWIVAKWGAMSAFVIGIGVALKNVISGMFGSAHEGLSTVLEGMGLSPEQADSGASIIFVALFVMILIYAIPYFTNKERVHRYTPVVKRTYERTKQSARNDWKKLNGDERR